MKQRKPFLLRLDPALHAAIEQWAEQELRSVNGQIEWILRNAVRERTGREPVADIVVEDLVPPASTTPPNSATLSSRASDATQPGEPK